MMTDALRGMVLAAGYGTRLAPVTDHVPKPLLTVGGVTLLERAITTLAAAGCRAVAVNTHHLGGMIARHLDAVDPPVPVTLFPEKEILGTGGALDGARPFLDRAEHFLLHNGDVLWHGDATALVRRHCASGALATLLLTDWPAVNSVVLDPEGAVLSLRRERDDEGRRLTYTGIGVFSRALLADIGTGFSSLIDPLERAVRDRPGSVQAVVEDAGHWSDLGTLGRYLGALGPGVESSGPLTVRPLQGHGSDRRFWRLAAAEWSAVAMVDAPGSDELDRQVTITRALHDAGLGAAGLLAVDEADRALLLEDLGDRDLWSAASHLGPEPEAWVALYAPAVDHLLRLQAEGQGVLKNLPAVCDRTLAYADLRGETNYFRVRFLQGYCRLPQADLAGLAAEFDALAGVVAAQPRVLIHRDYQSRNIMLAGGGTRLVDVQGMRQGPLLYDLASLLWDPYVGMPPQAREALVDRFATGLASRRSICVMRPTRSQVGAMFLAAGLQRLMQALGAYGFLGLVKGKPEFLTHVPRALAHLAQVLAKVRTDDHGAENLLPRDLTVLTRLVDRALGECTGEVTDD